jgi:hypothetical protein
MASQNDPHTVDSETEPKEPSVGLTLARLFRESIVPLTLAAVYAVWDTYQSHSAFSLSTFIKVLGPSFFFLMWLIGQYLRVSKQLHDRELLVGINADVQAIRAGLATREHRAEVPAAPEPEAPEIADPVAQDLFQQAQDALSNRLVLPALLMAGAAFEYSIRHAARRSGISEVVQVVRP